MDNCDVSVETSSRGKQESKADSEVDAEKISKEPVNILDEKCNSNYILEKKEESGVTLKLLDQEHKSNKYFKNTCYQHNLANDKDFCNTNIQKEANTMKYDSELNKTHFSSIEEQIAHLVGEVCYENADSCKEQNRSIRNRNEDEGNIENTKNNNSEINISSTKDHVEHLLEKQYMTHENPVDHEEIEDSETEESFTPFVKDKNQLDNTCRSRIGSEEDCQVGEQGSQISGGSSEKTSPNFESQRKEEFAISDNDFQYDAKYLLDVKEVKVLHECSICQYTTQNIGILRKHVSTIHNSKTTWKCKHCCKKFGSKIFLLKHVRKEHSKRSRKCPYCFCTLLCNGKVMNKHIKNMHPSKCLESVPIIKDKPQFDGLTRNGSRGMYRCNKCCYSNRDLSLMLSHIKMHNVKHVLKCLYCHYMINESKLYRIHLASAHKLAKKIYICSRCFFQCEDQETYEEHLYKPHIYHICASCDFKTYHIETYYAHTEMHENSKHNSENKLSYDMLKEHAEELKKDDKAVEDNSQDAIEVKKSDSIIENYPEEREHSKDENNIEFENLDYADVESRQETKAVLTENYTQRKEDGVTIFTCLKCDFNRNFRSISELCEHLANVHSIHSEKIQTEILKSKENTVEFVQVEVDLDPAKRYFIEPTAAKNLKTHIKNELLFRCEKCDFTAQTLQTKIFHEQECHSSLHFKCPTCSFEVNNGTVLIDHFKNHVDLTNQVLICPFCELELDNEILLKNHVNIEHLDMAHENLNDSTPKKDDGNIKMELVDAMLVARRMETTFFSEEGNSDEIYQCDLCSYNAVDLLSLESHLKNDHSIQSLKCPRCFQNQSSNLREFWDHLNQHCPQCRFRSRDPKKLRLHVLTHVPRYKKSNLNESKIRLKRSVIPDSIPMHIRGINSDKYRQSSMSEIGDLDCKLGCDEFEPEDISSEEIRIIFEDAPCEDDNSQEVDTSETNEKMRISIDSPVKRGNCDAYLKKNSTIKNDECKESFDLVEEFSREKRQEKEIRLIIDRSNVNSFNSKVPSIESCTFESSEKVIDRPVRIVKIPEFQCFDCLHVYKTRYTLVDHRKRLHGLKRPHSCTYCMDIFESYSYLKSHYYRIHKVSFHHKGPIFKCPLCEYNSIHLKQTQKHVMKIHQRNVIGFQKRGTC